MVDSRGAPDRDDLIQAGLVEPESESETTPSSGYPEEESITVTFTVRQGAMIVHALLEQARQMATSEQIEWSRLAIGINDLIVEDDNEGQPD